MADLSFLTGLDVAGATVVGVVVWASLLIVDRGAAAGRLPLWPSAVVRQVATKLGRRSFSLVGLLMFGSTQSAAALRRVLPSTRPVSAASEPSRAWAGEPPPHVFPSPAQSTGLRLPALVRSHQTVHPAVHGGTGVRDLGGPLFVREGRGSGVRVVRDRVPRAGWRGESTGSNGESNGTPPVAEEQSSANSRNEGAREPAVWEVKPGDSLWDIAEKALRTKDARRIARYWPKLHRLNRDVIGANPNLLQPGQKLRLPPERR